REGLDLPEVSLVAILDADKEGFLRSARALTQTAGRAARNMNSRVIMYADHETDAMKQTIEETNRRREKQMAYNKAHHITPKPIVKKIDDSLAVARGAEPKAYVETESQVRFAADPVIDYGDPKILANRIEVVKKLMNTAAKSMDFLEADRYLSELNMLLAKQKGLKPEP
ncbi:MAG: excinuclease ABC subunit B, partial [Bacteroidales bacterium]|nr:excinuclease ABC subunit B [Bacteroidales bacterium]